MLRKVRQFIVQHNLISPGELVVVGVSGGPDSVALLHLLDLLGKEEGFSIHAAHLNHGLRPEADEEEEFVKELAKSLGLGCTIGRAKVREEARAGRRSVEEAGRQARYAFFIRVAEELKADKVATAHHMGDQAETVLMHLLRGSGLKGLGGISPRRGIFIRPFLAVSRADIMSYLQENRLDYCLDASNYDWDYLRNRIRHQLIPLLEKEYNPNIVTSLCQLATVARDEDMAMEEMAVKAFKETARPEAGGLVLSLETMQVLPVAVQRRVILLALKQLGGEQGWEMKDVQSVLELARKAGSDKQICVGKNIWAKKSYGRIIVRVGREKTHPFRYFLEVPGKTYIEEIKAELVCRLRKREDVWPSQDFVCLDWDKLKKPLEVRSRRPGDRFRPLGLGGTKKLQDFLVDSKVPVEERDRVGLLACEDEIYWVIGYRLDERAVIDSTTKQVLVVEIRKKQTH
ncbi:MAG TPA: tRNA lysidine(34) synthetase TilS [Syntrophothermus lipocalidus]|nr:tRNA lysidine(34) synthetase TilS [Syntrophothermus lipocalidus]